MKHTIQRTLALLLALVFLIPQGISAEGTLTVTSVSGKNGEQAAVEVLLTGDDVCSGNFDVCFDNDSLELVSATKGNGSWLGTLNEKAPGVVRVSFAQAEPLSDVILCRLVFEVTGNTSAEGSPVRIENARLYDADAELTDTKLQFGSVTRECVWFTLENTDTVEGQDVRAQIRMTGALQPCGGNFTLTYDTTGLKATDVIPLEGLDHCQVQWNLEEEGIVRISFAGEQPVDDGVLCAVVFKNKGSAGNTTKLELSEVRAYDQDSKAMDTAISNGEIQVVQPTEADPKLWVVGGALNEDGTATASIVLQGRGKVCGGQCTLVYDPSMDVEIEEGYGVEYRKDAGKIHVSWAKESPAIDAETLITFKFNNAIESVLTFDSNVRVYDEKSEQIGVVDIRSGSITASERVHLVVENLAVEAEEERSEVSVTIDLADTAYFSEDQIDTLTPMLALYKNDQLIKIDVSPVSGLDDGVAEISLSATADTKITDYAVFIAGNGAMPLCGAIRSE